MKKLMDLSLSRMRMFAIMVLVVSIPVYYIIMSSLWQYELDEHNIVLTKEASYEDSILIVLAVTGLTIIFMIILLAGFVFINRKMSVRLWQPFYNTLSQIKSFELGIQQEIQFEKSKIVEFEELNSSLKKLIKGNIDTFRQQKEFADNASHELQTPLALVQSKLELFLQNSSITTEQYVIIGDALDSLSRINRINKNLLLLTKIENSQYNDKAFINVTEILQASLSNFNDLNVDSKIVIQSEISPNVFLLTNKTLVEIMFNNLISNAFRHGQAPGNVEVHLTKTAFQIANTGNNPLDEKNLFRRFGSASKDNPGTGLGLSLVNQISVLYGWKVKYRFENNMHIFLVEF